MSNPYACWNCDVDLPNEDGWYCGSRQFCSRECLEMSEGKKQKPHGPWGNAAGIGPVCQTCGTDDMNEPECKPLPEKAASTRLPTDPQKRKRLPITTGVLDYFPDAIAAVSAVSLTGNEQHNPGEPLHWARGKSMDQADTIVRHLMERGTIDTDGHRHSAKVAWRALALLQLEIEEAEGLPPSRGSKK